MRNLLLLLIGCVLFAGCSLAMDFDSLQEGTPDPVDTDTGPCTEDSQCDDGIDCTVNECLPDGSCLYTPDNDLCEYLEMCDYDEGCVPTGKECFISSDCDDDIDCTVDTCILGDCKNEADDLLCENDNPCILGEECNPESGCTVGWEMNCDQPETPCSYAECDSDTGECAVYLLPGADDDEDTFLDIVCGGDDCNDADENIHPETSDLCNMVDDDCDGMTDVALVAGSIELATGMDLAAPALAFDGEHFAVVWQQGAGGAEKVLARIVNLDGTPATDAVDFTAEGGDGATGEMPFVTTVDGEFLVVWISRPSAGEPDVYLTGMTLNSTSADIDFWSNAQQLGDGVAGDLFHPRVAADGSEWAAVWGAVYSPGEVGESWAVELQTQDMHAHPSTVFTVDETPQPLFDIGVPQRDAVVDLAVLGTADYAVSWNRQHAATDGDREVFATRVGLETDIWINQSGWPSILSAATTQSDESYGPVLLPDGAGQWITTFTDQTEDGGDLDVVAHTTGGLITLHGNDAANQIVYGITPWGDDGYAELHVHDVGAVQALDLRLLDNGLSQHPNQAGRLAIVSAGTAHPSRLVRAENSMAVAWIESTLAGGTLKLAVFDGCVTSTK